MTNEERVAKVTELESLIRQAKTDYYNEQPSVIDAVYDAWVDELAELDAINEVLTSVGAPSVSEWKKVKHENPMGSLDKVNTLEEMTAWVNATCPGESLLLTEKLDGISIQLRYRNGKLVEATTRGDGYVGEDITVNVAKMKGVPEKLRKKASVTLRGEIILRKSDLAAWFSEYANTRNAASGISKRLDGQGCEHLTVMFYQVADGESFATEKEQFEYIESLGLGTPYWAVSGMWVGIKTPHDYWVEYQEGRRDRLDYEIDGLVVRVNDLSKQLALGDKDLRPKGAVAFKFAPVARETVLREFLLQTGGTGRITPVAVFDPVNLMGATVTNASVYNWKYIRDLGLDVGARILVARANDVIPRVLSVVKGTGTVAAAPTTCASCGAGVMVEGEYLVCPNRDGCPAQVTGRLSQWITSLNILEWGDVLLEKLVTAGLVKSIPDLYRLTEEQIAGLDRMGPKGAAKALLKLREKNPLPLEVILGALTISNVATSTVKLVMDAGYDTVSAMKAASLEQLGAVKGLGPVKAQALFTWLRDHGDFLDDLFAVGVQVQERIKGKFTGMSFCFTGSMKHKRPDLEAMVAAAGGEVKSSVNKKLTYLVLADTTTTKAAAAMKHGVQCLTEDEFLQLVG